MKRVFCAAVLLIALAVPAWAGFYEGVAAYERGDYATALREFRPLAVQDHASAQFNLGLMYGEGRGVPQDYLQAHVWSNLAASTLTSEVRDTAVNNRDFAASQMTPAQIAEAQKLAREWRPASER